MYCLKNKKMKNILMTGGTGIVGVPTLKKFLQNGDRVYCLVRRQGLTTARERLLKKLGVKELPTNCFVLEGDVTLPNCGLNQGGIELLKLVKIDTLFHCAALTKMDDKNAEKSNEINVVGTLNTIGLAKRIGALKLHFISTAYVANGASNVYEKNKAKAEKLVEMSEIPYTISRLSVVIGDAKTGEITDFSGLYGFFLTAYKILKSTGFNTQLNVEAAPGATLNLITADWAADCLFKITHKIPQNKTLNIVDNNPMSVKQIIHEGALHMGIRENLMIHDSVDTTEKSDNISQLIFNRVIEILRPYTCKNFSVNDQDLSTFLGESFTNQTQITPSTIATALDFALVASGLEESVPAQQAS